MTKQSRRQFVSTGVGLFAVWPWLNALDLLAAPLRRKTKITDIKTMVLQGPRTYTLAKVESDAGVHGIGEAYGSPGIGVKQGIEELKPQFVGKDPLGIEVLTTSLGWRTDGSAHSLMRAVAGIEIALWDLAGKLLEVPTVTLLGGTYRDRVRMYCHESPANMLDKDSCRQWADRVRQHSAGFTAFKFGFPHTSPQSDPARDPANRMLTTLELANIARGFANCREAIGWDRDIMVHCHWEYNLPAAIQLAKAIEPIKPLWLEDPLPVDYSDSWKRLVASTSVPILMGENLDRRGRFKDFIVNQACDIVQLDIRNTGGLLEAKKIADLADTFNMPMAAHNTGSLVSTMATAQWAATVRDFLAAETVVGRGDWMDDIVLRDRPVFQDGCFILPNKPGLAIELDRAVVEAHLAAGETWWG